MTAGRKLSLSMKVNLVKSLNFEHESKSRQISGFDNSVSGRGQNIRLWKLNSIVFWVQTQIASTTCYWKPVRNVNQPICMENAHQQDCATVYLFRQVYILPSNHEKIVFKDMYWNWQSRLLFRLLWKRKPKIHKGEESGVEDGSIGSV